MARITCRSRLETLAGILHFLGGCLGAAACLAIFLEVDILKILAWATYVLPYDHVQYKYELFAGMAGACEHESNPDGSWRWMCLPWENWAPGALYCADTSATPMTAAGPLSDEGAAAYCALIGMKMVLPVLTFAGMGLPVASPILLGCVVMRCTESKKLHKLFTVVCSTASGLCFAAVAVLYATASNPVPFLIASVAHIVESVDQQTGFNVVPSAGLGVGWLCTIGAAACMLASAAVSAALVDPKACTKKAGAGNADRGGATELSGPRDISSLFA